MSGIEMCMVREEGRWSDRTTRGDDVVAVSAVWRNSSVAGPTFNRKRQLPHPKWNAALLNMRRLWRLNTCVHLSVWLFDRALKKSCRHPSPYYIACVSEIWIIGWGVSHVKECRSKTAVKHGTSPRWGIHTGGKSTSSS